MAERQKERIALAVRNDPESLANFIFNYFSADDPTKENLNINWRKEDNDFVIWKWGYR